MDIKQEAAALEPYTGGGRVKSTLAKVVETGFLVATWLALGLYLEIFGPTQKDLMLKLNTDYERISVAVAGRPVGLFPGCVLGGLLVDRFPAYCHVMLAVSLEIGAAVTYAVPWSPDVQVMWVLCFIGGLVESVINIAGQRLILKMWQEKAATPMILLHSGYGVGSFVIPLYTNPFRAHIDTREVPLNISSVNAYPGTHGTNNTATSSSSALEMSTSAFVNTTIETFVTRESRVEYTYIISATLVLLHSLAFYVFQFRERYYDDVAKPKADTTKGNGNRRMDEIRRFMKMINPATCTGGRMFYGIQLFFLLFLYFANAGGGERMVANFIRSFSIDQLKLSADNASFLNTSFWISFAVGRVSFSIAARWISMRKLILIQTGGLATVAVLMNFLAVDNATAYWVLVQPLGVFIAPLWPGGVAWADYHLELTGMGMMIILLGGSVGGICHMALIGFIYEHYGSRMFLYQLAGYGGLALLVAISLDLVGGQHGNRFKWNKKEKHEGDLELKSDPKEA